MKNNSMKRNSRSLLVGAMISFILLVAIIGSIFYKTEQGNTMEQPAPVKEQVDLKEEKQVEQPKEQPVSDVVEEPVTPELKPEPEPEPEPKQEPAPAVTEKPVESAPKKEGPAVVAAQEQPVAKSGYVEGQQLPTEPTYIDGILIANKKYPLPASYNKGEDPEAKEALASMIAAAEQDGIELVAFSGFRSYEYQTTLYNNYVARDGQAAADRYSARPGHSEHQTGLAFDIGEKGREDLWLTSAFGETKAGKWLVNNAHSHGFILRYPKGKEHITGFMYESWHFRYLGVETATKVVNSGVTLEEYLGIN